MDLKIIYFNFPFWRAEVSRISLFIGNIPFEDRRLTNEDFSYVKEHGHMKDGTKIPFSQFPVLVINGGKVDQVIDAATDINMLIRPSMRENDPIKKKEMREDLSKNDLPRYFSYLENLLSNNKSQWFVGNKMSIADIAIWRISGWLTSGIIDDIPKNLIDKFDNLKDLYSLVNNDKKIKEWVSKTYK